MSDIPIYYDPRLECWVLPDEEKIKWVQSNISSELSGDESNQELIALFDAFTQTKRIKVKLDAAEKARRFYDMSPKQPDVSATTPPPQPEIKHVLSEAITGYIEDKSYGLKSTIITSQLPVTSWHEAIGDPTLADAILDRIVHNAHKIEMKGESMRKSGKTLTKVGHLT